MHLWLRTVRAEVHLNSDKLGMISTPVLPLTWVRRDDSIPVRAMEVRGMDASNDGSAYEAFEEAPHHGHAELETEEEGKSAGSADVAGGPIMTTDDQGAPGV
jgi:hypothetical protein